MSTLDEEARRIIVEGTGADVPPADASARIWRGVHARLDLPLSPVASAAAEGLGASSSTGLVSALGAKLVAGGLLMSAVTGVSVYVVHAGKQPLRADAPVATTAVAHGTPRTVPVSLADLPRAEPEPPASRPAAKPETPNNTPRAVTSSLTDETPLVFEAQRALGAGMPSRALSLLDQHRLRFPRGELAQEREVARALALCMLGRSSEAERVRGRFLRDWPGSPLAPRMRAVCSPSEK